MIDRLGDLDDGRSPRDHHHVLVLGMPFPDLAAFHDRWSPVRRDPVLRADVHPFDLLFCTGHGRIRPESSHPIRVAFSSIFGTWSRKYVVLSAQPRGLAWIYHPRGRNVIRHLVQVDLLQDRYDRDLDDP